MGRDILKVMYEVIGNKPDTPAGKRWKAGDLFKAVAGHQLPKLGKRRTGSDGAPAVPGYLDLISLAPE